MKVGLLWHSLISGNMGVRALTVANMAIIDAVAQKLGIPVDYVIFGVGERFAAAQDKDAPPFFPMTIRSILSPRGFWRALSDIDVMIDIGAGDSFADIYGAKRFAFLWLSKVMTIARGIPLLFAPQTIGPFDKFIYRKLASFAMRHSAAVIARDRASLALAKAMAPAARALVSVDVAFKLPFADQSASRDGADVRIGLNVSGLLYHEAESGRNRFGLSYDYADYVRSLIATISAWPNTKLYLVPHATSASDPSDDDGHISDRLAKEFPAARRVENFTGASEAKSFISGLDFLVAARMHACIGAYSSGTPVYPVAYSRKFAGLFGMVDYPHILPVSGYDTAGAVAATLAAIENRAALKSELTAGMHKVEALLDVYRAELEQLLSAKAA